MTGREIRVIYVVLVSIRLVMVLDLHCIKIDRFMMMVNVIGRGVLRLLTSHFVVVVAVAEWLQPWPCACVER